MADFEAASHAFLSWLRNSGSDISPKIQIADLRSRNAGRGVIASQYIPEHTTLFRIPRSAILSVENSLLSAEIPAATFDTLGPWLSLILVMLYEHLNGSASSWHPYFAVLPTEFNTLMFWSADELAELQGSAVVHKIGREGADQLFREQIVPVIVEFAELIFAGDESAKQRAEEMRSKENIMLMHKMGSLIMAYAFDMEPATPDPRKEVDDEGFAEEEEDAALPKGMVPLADMLNADADRCNARLFYEQEYLEMKALKPIKTGEEILNDYGPLPRSDLLRRYGYVTENYTQYDVVEISTDLVMAAATAAGIDDAKKLEYLDDQSVLDEGYDIVASSPFTLQESVSPELTILIETLLLSGEEFNRLRCKGKLPKPDKITIRGAELLHKIVQARIADYATSLDDDLRDNNEKGITGDATTTEHRCAMARAVRIGEKTLLAQVEAALAEMIARDGTTSKRQRDVDEEGDVEMGGTGKKQRA